MANWSSAAIYFHFSDSVDYTEKVKLIEELEKLMGEVCGVDSFDAHPSNFDIYVGANFRWCVGSKLDEVVLFCTKHNITFECTATEPGCQVGEYFTLESDGSYNQTYFDAISCECPICLDSVELNYNNTYTEVVETTCYCDKEDLIKFNKLALDDYCRVDVECYTSYLEDVGYQKYLRKCSDKRNILDKISFIRNCVISPKFTRKYRIKNYRQYKEW